MSYSILRVWKLSWIVLCLLLSRGLSSAIDVPVPAPCLGIGRFLVTSHLYAAFYL